MQSLDCHRTPCKIQSANQKWLDMAVLDLIESKKAGAAAFEQVKVLVEEKEILKEKLKIHHDLWELEKRQLEESLMLTKQDHENNTFSQAYEIALLKVSINSEKQDSLCFKLKLEGAVDEIDFLYSRLQILGLQLRNKEVQFKSIYESHTKRAVSQEKTSDSHQHNLDKLKKEHHIEIQSLKNEQANMTTKWKQEVSALIREKNFVWGQFKRMEDNHTGRLEKKIEELKAAELHLQSLQLRVEELEKANDEKTVESTVLRINVETVEEELSKLRGELLQLKEAGHIHHCEGAKEDGITDNENVLVSEECQETLNTEVSDLTHTLVEKEEQLKKAEKLMHELRRENENLRLLYADLEQQFKDKQKPAKPKDTTTRNLTAELEAVAPTARTSPKNSDFPKSKESKNGVKCGSKSAASLDLKRKRPKSCPKFSKKREKYTPIDGTLSKTQNSSLSTKYLDKNENTSHKVQPQLNSVLAVNNIQKSKLFSSVFAIPKVLPM